MAYIKTVWQDSPSTATPINAENLNNIEDGIEDVDTRVTAIENAGIVESFNGRTGTVTPTDGDYSAEQITYGDSNVETALGDLASDVTNIDTFTASGESFALTDTSEGNVLAHTLYGMSVQDGTPTPSVPVDIESSVANFTCANSDSTESVTITTDLTLRAIEVTSSDNYNLVRDGKYYIADSVEWSEDYGYVLTRRVGTITFDGIETWTKASATYADAFWTSVPNSNSGDGSSYLAKYGNSNYFVPNTDGGQIEIGKFSLFTSRVYVSYSTYNTTSLSDFTAWVTNNNIILNYLLETPTTSPLTAQQAEALLSLKTYDTATSIVCTADVSPTMEIEYAKERVPALALSGHNESELKVDWASENVLGAKNMIPYPYYTYFYEGASYTTSGITFTTNGDGSVTANGTATANAVYICHHRIDTQAYKFVVPNGKYILSGCPSGGGDVSNYNIIVARSYNSAFSQIAKDIGNGVEFTLDGDDFSTDNVTLYIGLNVYNGTTVSNLTFKPMIRSISVKDSTYAPYAMTNKDLTDVVKCNQTTAGTYTLQATVDSSGIVTYSWV